MNQPTVSVIFPTFNGWPETRKCLASIKKLAYPLDQIETIVIDNGSSDNTVACVRKNFPWVKIFPQKANLGFAKAINLGIKKAKGEYLLITNNDVLFEKKYLITLVEYLRKNPKVGIIGGKVYYQKPKEKIAFAGAKFSFYTGLLKPNPQPNQIFPTDWVTGCDFLIKREVLEKIGNFDEKFFFYFEDLDLCLRTKKAGFGVVYYPKAVMYHGEGTSIDKEPWQAKSEFYYYGKTRVLFKHVNKLQLVSSLLFQFTIGLAYQMIYLKHPSYSLAFRALVKNIKDFT